LEDYVFFGKIFRWQPSEIDRLKWSYRKEIKQAWKDHQINTNKGENG
jgi:hypothetical protein